jgi:hypothetical protein
MSININDLNENFSLISSSSLSGNQNIANNLRELSEKELEISGGADSYGFRTVIISDDDLDVYYVADTPPANIIYNPGKVNIRSGGKINFEGGNVRMKGNGDLDITFSDSDSSNSSSS